MRHNKEPPLVGPKIWQYVLVVLATMGVEFAASGVRAIDGSAPQPHILRTLLWGLATAACFLSALWFYADRRARGEPARDKRRIYVIGMVIAIQSMLVSVLAAITGGALLVMCAILFRPRP